MVGSPGSGKSYVSDWLTPMFEALRLRSDDLRVAMLGPLRPEFHDEPYSSMISGAMKYAAKQAFTQNHSVVYDTNNNSVERRQELSALAKQFEALTVVVWIQTPQELAKERALERDMLEDSKVTNVDYVDKMAAQIEPPTSDELVIKLDGTNTSQAQQASFSNQLRKLDEIT